MDHRRPRDELGALLRDALGCPFCGKPAADPMAAMMKMAGAAKRKPLRVVAYRQKSIRLECRECGLRFSVDPVNLADTFAQREAPTPKMIDAQARQAAKDNPSLYLDALSQTKRMAARFVNEQRAKILEPHRQALDAATPRKGQIRFPKRRTATK